GLAARLVRAGHRAGAAGHDLAVGQRPDLHGPALHDRVAQAHLAVAHQGGDAVPVDGHDRGPVESLHRQGGYHRPRAAAGRGGTSAGAGGVSPRRRAEGQEGVPRLRLPRGRGGVLTPPPPPVYITSWLWNRSVMELGPKECWTPCSPRWRTRSGGRSWSAWRRARPRSRSSRPRSTSASRRCPST